MSPRLLFMNVIAVVCGAVIGLIVVNALHALFANGDFVALTVDFGRVSLALVTVAIYAVWYHYLPQTPAALTSFFTGVALPSVVVMFTFDTPLNRTTVLELYAAFAVVSLLTYRFVLSNAAVRRAAGEVAGVSNNEAPPR